MVLYTFSPYIIVFPIRLHMQRFRMALPLYMFTLRHNITISHPRFLVNIEYKKKCVKRFFVSEMVIVNPYKSPISPLSDKFTLRNNITMSQNCCHGVINSCYKVWEVARYILDTMSKQIFSALYRFGCITLDSPKSI